MSNKDKDVSGALALLELSWRCETLVEEDGDPDTNEVKGAVFGVLEWECVGQGGSRRVLSSNFLRITISGSWTFAPRIGDLRCSAMPSLRSRPLHDPFAVGLSFVLSPSLGSPRSAKLEGLTMMW